MALTRLLVTGVIGAIAALLLSSLFGQSTPWGYRMPGGGWGSKETAALLKLLKMFTAGAIAAAVGAFLLTAGPVVIFLVVIGGVILVLHGEIDHWNLR